MNLTYVQFQNKVYKFLLLKVIIIINCYKSAFSHSTQDFFFLAKLRIYIYFIFSTSVH